MDSPKNKCKCLTSIPLCNISLGIIANPEDVLLDSKVKARSDGSKKGKTDLLIYVGSVKIVFQKKVKLDLTI